MTERLSFWAFKGSKTRGKRAEPTAIPLFDVNSLILQNRGPNEDHIRALCQAVSLTPNHALARVLGRYKMYVDPQDFGLSPHLILDGYWEMPTTEAIVQCLRPGMIAADVGANVGYFTMLMADLTGPGGKVIAFEPNPAMAERIKRSAYLNGFSNRIDIYPVALDCEHRQVSFLMPSDEPKNAYIRPYEGLELTGAVILEAERLDSRAEWREIEFLKIDAEGAEENIWAGAAGLRTADRLKTIILEFQPGRYSSAVAFIKNICAWGFTLEWIDPANGIQDISLESIMQLAPDEDIMLVFRR